jgi:hypothetical protein
MPWGAIIGAGIGLLGSSMQADAAQAGAQANVEAARIAAEAQKFRPVGVTTRFGTSQFTTDANGNVTNAGYNVAPDIAMMRDRLLSQAGGQGFQTAEQAQQAQQSLFGLGQQFLPTSTQYQVDPNATAYANQLRGLSQQVLPQNYDTTAAAQQYMQQQQALLQPSREQAQASLTQNLFNTGRGGVAVSQGGMLGAANPEQQALLNARSMQDLQLAANAQQQARANLSQDISLGTQLGSSALNTAQNADTLAYQRMMNNINAGSGLFGTGIDLATAGYNPLKTQFGLGQTIDAAGQNALDLGVNIGGRTTQGATNAANTLYQAQTNANAANAYSPVGASLMGAAGNQQLLRAFTNMANPFGGTPQGAYGQQDQYLAGALSNPQTQQANMLAAQNEWFK